VGCLRKTAVDVDTRMRAVLVQLALTSNGNVAKMDANRGGGSARHYADALLVGWLDPLDAPHQRYLDLYIAEETDAERAAVLDLAETSSTASASRAGTPASPRRSTSSSTGSSPSARAGQRATSRSACARASRSSPRAPERGRDQEKGKPVEDSSGLGRDERRARVRS
jgi:hypothetical protein